MNDKLERAMDRQADDNEDDEYWLEDYRQGILERYGFTQPEEGYDWDTEDAAERDATWAEGFAIRDEIRRLRAIQVPPETVSSATTEIPRLQQRLEELMDVMLVNDWGYPPPGWVPPKPKEPASQKPAGVRPVRDLSDRIAERLTDDERRHWQWIRDGRKHREIATILGISQPAVSKRESKLRDRVNAIAVEMTGRPYPFLAASLGGRKRRL